MKGFTLVEMMVALFIFGLLTASGVAVMRFTVDSQEILHGHTERLAAFQRTRALLKSDLAQAAPRRTRDGQGRAIREAFYGGDPDSGLPLLRFVRRGWENPDGDARASLQYVEYALVEGRLERSARLALDGGAPSEPQILIDGVTSADVSFLWDNQWIETLPGGPENPLPQAIRLDLSFHDMGAVSQLFTVTGEPQ
ncbi:MAG: type secretion system protein [Pseudomonadota bacterium]|jgi:general secretion pathway protein J